MKIEPTKPIAYVTRDIERAIGLEPRDGYFIIANKSPYGEKVKARYPDNVLLVEDPRGTVDTFDLLARPDVSKLISSTEAHIVVFQNTPRIERLAAERGWKLLNPSAALSNVAEEKISQIAFLEEDAKLLPPHRIAALKDIAYAGKRFVLQFNRSHTGQGTYIIDSQESLAKLAASFPDRPCRAVEFVTGPVYTANVVAATTTIVGNASYQITGLAPFTDLPFSTIGNDWSLPARVLSGTQKDKIDLIARNVAARMKKSGWKGLFGIDVIVDEASGEVYLLEINARQPASAVFESELQKKADPAGVTTFEAHIAALLGDQLAPSVTRIADGAQVVKRVTEKAMAVDVASLEAKGLSLIEYKNYVPNQDLLRIQSSAGIMESHGRWNELGSFIASCIKEIK